MKYQPKRIGKRPEKIALFLFFLAIVAVFMANVAVSAMQWALQLAAVVLLGVFIYILVRFSYTEYMYEIRAKSKMEALPFQQIPPERLTLYIHKRQGSRAFATEFACDLSKIRSVDAVEGKAAKKGKRYFYYRNMAVKDGYVLTVDMDGEDVYVFLELGEGSEDILSFIKAKI